MLPEVVKKKKERENQQNLGESKEVLSWLFFLSLQKP